MSLALRGDVRATRVARARRILTFLVPPVVIVVFVWLGRFATSAAAPSAPSPALAEVGAPSASPSASSTISGDSAPASPDASADAPRPAVELQADGAVLVDLNLATVDDLRRLPGVGPTRAKAIVDLRVRLGRIKSIDDLARIKGFGRATLRRLRPLVRVGP